MPTAPPRERSPLAIELKKRLPFESPLEEAVLNLFRTQAVLAARVDQLLKPFKLSNPKYNVLRILRGVSQSDEACDRRLPSLDVAERMITRVPDITRLVDGLVADGLVKRMRCPRDRRVVYVAITAKGKRKVDSIDEPMAALHRELLQSMGSTDLQMLNQLLDKVRAAGAAATKDA